MTRSTCRDSKQAAMVRLIARLDAAYAGHAAG